MGGAERTATIYAIIGENGKPRHVCVGSGDRVWGKLAVDALRQWQFEPATLEGKPVAVQFEMVTTFRRER
jgi:hypothetical protein